MHTTGFQDQGCRPVPAALRVRCPPRDANDMQNSAEYLSCPQHFARHILFPRQRRQFQELCRLELQNIHEPARLQHPKDAAWPESYQRAGVSRQFGSCCQILQGMMTIFSCTGPYQASVWCRLPGNLYLREVGADLRRSASELCRRLSSARDCMTCSNVALKACNQPF